jgi:hypothetical protein
MKENIRDFDSYDFESYDRDNPEIWKGFVKFARQAKAKGFKHYSAYGIFEIMRWHTGVRGDGEFKLQNNYRPDYARKMMRTYPEFKGFFRIRELSVIRK